MEEFAFNTLEELEEEYWGDSPFGVPSVDRTYNLRRVPLRELTLAEVLFMLGQKSGARYIVPLVLPLLRDNPLFEAEYYPGDLLENVLRSDPRIYLEMDALRGEVIQIAHMALALMPLRPEGIYRSVNQTLQPLLSSFISAFDDSALGASAT
ncbi:MAG: hypothetical protein DCC75_07555 [Proteobacteria bacterium]|nr:MAG: hypothetical protein DCC75_07555 [Pseudomonadota bacterium]